MKRCFGEGKPFYEKYHDEEWGVPSRDDRYLFEMLCLEGAQAGLSWETILKKREGYKRLFHNFVPEIVAAMGDEELERALLDPSVVRNRRKVYSVRDNAKIFLEMQKEFGSFAAYLWAYVDDTPINNGWERAEDVPCSTPLSDAISKDLKKRGMRFVGSTIIYSYLQAVGLINDHLVSCLK